MRYLSARLGKTLCVQVRDAAHREREYMRQNA